MQFFKKTYSNKKHAQFSKLPISTASNVAAFGFTGSTAYGIPDTALYSITMQAASAIQTDGSIQISGVAVAQQYFVYQYQCITFYARMIKGTGITFQFNNPSATGTVVVTKLS